MNLIEDQKEVNLIMENEIIEKLNYETFLYEGLNIEYNGYTLSGLYSFTIMSGNYDTIYLSKTKINKLIKQKNGYINY